MEPVSAAAMWQAVAAAVIFIAAYALIIMEKINRAVVVLAGAVLASVLGIADFEQVYLQHIDWQMIGLLAGMMILAEMTRRSGACQYFAVLAAVKAKGDPVKIFLILTLLTAFVSAFLGNAAAVLLIVPVTFSVARPLQTSPLPFLIGEMMAANAGGAASMTGNMANMMIGSATGVPFRDFLFHLGPPAAIVLGIHWLLLYMMFAGQLRVPEKRRTELAALDPEDYVKDRKLMRKTLIVLSFTFAGFLLHDVIQAEMSVIALAGALILLLAGVRRQEHREALRSVEWTVLLFFAGLFALAGALAETGVISYLAARALEITEGDMLYTSILLLWVSGFVSATADSIPFTAAMIPLILDLSAQMNITDPAGLNLLWWSLALGAGLGGSGTILGASANMIAAGLAVREGYPLGFAQYLKIGVPLTFVSLLISTGFVLLIRFLTG